MRVLSRFLWVKFGSVSGWVRFFKLAGLMNWMGGLAGHRFVLVFEMSDRCFVCIGRVVSLCEAQSTEVTWLRCILKYLPSKKKKSGYLPSKQEKHGSNIKQAHYQDEDEMVLAGVVKVRWCKEEKQRINGAGHPLLF